MSDQELTAAEIQAQFEREAQNALLLTRAVVSSWPRAARRKYARELTRKTGPDVTKKPSSGRVRHKAAARRRSEQERLLRRTARALRRAQAEESG